MASTVGVRSWSARKYFAEASSSSWSRAVQPWLSCSTWTCTSMASRASMSTRETFPSGELGAGLGVQQGGQDGVAMSDERGGVAEARRGDLVVHSRDEGVDELGGQRDLTQVAPPRLGGWAQVLEDVGDPAGTSGEVLVEERPEDRPAQSGAVGDGGVDVGDGRDAALDQRVG